MALICSLLFLAPQTSFSRQPKTTDTVTLQLKWKHQFQFAGYYAALARGYYRDVGLNVVLKEGRLGLKISDEVVSKPADY